jgi:hypothetical protein
MNGFQFPASVTDANGTELVPCTDGTAACGSLAVGDVTAPDGEGFYWSADSDDVPVGNGTVTLTLAHEFAFGGVDNKTPITFSSIRFTFKGAPGGRYTFDTPYETGVVIEHDAARRNEGVDLGCGPAAVGDVCNFAAADTTPVGPWLTSTSAPAGYLGDGATADTVIGSPLGVDRNAFTVHAPDGSTATTDKFIVLGKIGTAVPKAVISATSGVAFGQQPTGTQITKTVTGSGHARIAEMTTAGAASVTPSDIARPMRNRNDVSVRVRTSKRRSRYSYAV